MARVELISVHVPKTAGTSFLHVLRQVYGADRVHRERQFPGDGSNAVFLADRPRWEREHADAAARIPPATRVIHGQFPLVKYVHAFAGAARIAWLRHPVDRVISNYYFLKSRPPDPAERNLVRDVFAGNVSLLDYARADECRDRMTRLSLSEFPPEEMTFLGVVERFADDLAKLADILGWPPVEAPRLRVNTHPNYASIRVPDEVRAEIESLNPRDMELYRQVLAAGVDEPTQTSYDAWARNRRPQRGEVALLEDGTGAPRMAIVILVAEGDQADAVKATRGSTDNQLHAPSEVIEVPTGSLREAVERVSAEWFAVVVAGQVLQPRALSAAAAMLVQDHDTDVVYTDEDRSDQSGERIEPILKPGWSPRLLLEGNYAGGITFMRRSAVVEVGGLHPDDEPTGCYDTLLRLSERGRPFLHIPEPLLTARSGSPWPATAGRTGRAAGKRCVERALARRQIAGTVTRPTQSPWFTVRRKRPARPPITIIIPTRDRRDLLERCIDSLESTTSYPALQIMVVDNDSSDRGTLAYIEAMRHQVLRVPSPFNFSSIVNAAVEAAQTDYVVLLNNDTAALDPGWLETMVDEARDDRVGAVGCALVDAAGNVVHEGVGLGLGGAVATNLRLGGYLHLGEAVREVSAVTAACMLVRVSAFRAVRGFDPRLRIGYGDVDFCLRLWRHGYSVIYTPSARLEHMGQASRSGMSDATDEQLFRTLWGDRDGRFTDPFLSPLIEALNPLRLGGDGAEVRREGELRSALDRATVYARQLERGLEVARKAEVAQMEEMTGILRERMEELRVGHTERRHLQLDLHVKDDYIAQLKAEAAELANTLLALTEENELARQRLAAHEAQIAEQGAQLLRLDLVRYRVADRVNERLLQIPVVHRTAKSLAKRRRKNRPDSEPRG